MLIDITLRLEGEPTVTREPDGTIEVAFEENAGRAVVLLLTEEQVRSLVRQSIEEVTHAHSGG